MTLRLVGTPCCPVDHISRPRPTASSQASLSLTTPTPQDFVQHGGSSQGLPCPPESILAKGLASPIAELPAEILGGIFIQCLPSLPTAFQSKNVPRKFEAPMLLCRACVHWREITLNIPMLWTSFSALPPNKPPKTDDIDGYLALIKFWLDRSRQHSLSLELGQSLFDPKGLGTASFPLLLSEMDRWRDVTVLFLRR
jgi:hypothetical protein